MEKLRVEIGVRSQQYRIDARNSSRHIANDEVSFSPRLMTGAVGVEGERRSVCRPALTGYYANLYQGNDDEPVQLDPSS